MIPRLFRVLVIILFVTLQITLGNWLGWMTPELFLAGLMAICLTGNLFDTIWWMILGGLLIDLTIGSIPGLYLLLLTLTSLILSLISRQVLSQPSLPIAFIVFLTAAVLFSLCLNIVHGTFHLSFLLPSFITAILATIFYGILSALGTRREAIQLG